MTAVQYLILKPGDKVRAVAPKTNIGKITRSTILPGRQDSFIEDMLKYNKRLITVASTYSGYPIICTDNFNWLPEWIELPYTFKEL